MGEEVLTEGYLEGDQPMVLGEEGGESFIRPLMIGNRLSGPA